MGVLSNDAAGQGKDLFDGTQTPYTYDDTADNKTGGTYTHRAKIWSAHAAQALQDWLLYLSDICGALSGGTAKRVYFVGGDGTPTTSADLQFDDATDTLSVDAVETEEVNSTGTSGLAINTGATVESDGTLVFSGDATVFEDYNVAALALSGPDVDRPDTVEFLAGTGAAGSGIYGLGFAVGEYVSGAIEVPHAAKSGGTVSAHIHFGINDALTGTDKVRFQLTFASYTTGEVMPTPVVLTSEVDVDTQLEQYVATFDVSSYVAPMDQFAFSIERIAATANEYGGDAVALTVGLHCEVDMLGSRQITTK